MVLHNDKWKYKAKKAVERKNAARGKLANPDTPQQKDPSTTQDGEKNDDDEDEEDEEDNSNNDLQESNAWRFADPITDESILKDPEYQAQLESQRREEEDRMNYMRNTVVQKIPIQDGDYLLHGNKDISSLKKVKEIDFANWEVKVPGIDDDEDDDDESNANTPQIRTFTDEERAKFVQLQQKIKHQKEVAALKAKISSQNNAATKGKVLELDTGRGNDNYRNIVDKRLGKAHNNTGINTEDLDDLVGGMLGIDLKNVHSNDDDPLKTSGFDIDTIISKPAAPAGGKLNNKAKNTTVVLQTSAEDEDFLDSLL